jgi:hypothetical protein
MQCKPLRLLPCHKGGKCFEACNLHVALANSESFPLRGLLLSPLRQLMGKMDPSEWERWRWKHRHSIPGKRSGAGGGGMGVTAGVVCSGGCRTTSVEIVTCWQLNDSLLWQSVDS